MKKRILHLLMFVFTFAPVFAQVNITIELNSATIGDIDPTGLYIAGGCCFGGPGDNPLTDPDGDGIYTATLEREVGFSSYYTFTNGNCPDYSCKENIAGLPCSDPMNFNDRFLPPVMSDTTILACFGTCDFDGSCTIVTDSIDITFELNTATIDVDPTGVYLAGGGNFGIPGDNPMIDPEGDGIYTITVTKPQGFASYYTFTNGSCGDFSCKEDLAGLPCADPNAFNDRFLPSTMTDTTIKACFGNCVSDGSCDDVGLNNLAIDETLFTLQSSIVHDFANITFGENAIYKEKQVMVMNAVGQVLYTANVENAQSHQINAGDFANGIYFLSVQTEGTILTKKFVVSK